jgi:uracil-DNA glycosylase family 4
VLHELGIEDSTILWNAVPWHPFSNDPHTNRTPTQAERQAGMPFLKTFIQLYSGAVVVAVGNTASNSLTELHIEHTKVRHPANGGARKFAESLRQLMSK